MFTRGLSPTKQVLGFGLPHLGEGRVASIDDFRVKSLCQGHNSELSNLDQAAIDVMNVARETNEVARIRLSKPGQRWNRLAYELDGTRFERWALKTTISASQSNAWPGDLPGDLPFLVFGKKAFPPGCGLALLDQIEDPFEAYNGVACTYYRLCGSPDIVASIIGLGGFMILCSWARQIAELIPLRAERLRAEVAVLHKRSVEIPRSNVWIKFDWTGSYSNERDARICELRAKYASPPR